MVRHFSFCMFGVSLFSTFLKHYSVGDIETKYRSSRTSIDLIPIPVSVLLLSIIGSIHSPLFYTFLRFVIGLVLLCLFHSCSYVPLILAQSKLDFPAISNAADVPLPLSGRDPWVTGRSANGSSAAYWVELGMAADQTWMKHSVTLKFLPEWWLSDVNINHSTAIDLNLKSGLYHSWAGGLKNGSWRQVNAQLMGHIRVNIS